MRETAEQFTARMLMCALGVGNYGGPSDEDLARLTAMAQSGPSPEEQAADAASDEPGLAPPSVAG